MEFNKCNLNKIFDKIYVIHCVENKKRYENILYQQNNNDIDLDIWWTCYHPWSQQMLNGLLLSNRGRYIINGSELNLTREFYTIIKTSYLRGYEHILIFEDDFSLIKSKYLKEYLNNMPKDFDIIQFSILFNRDLLDDISVLFDAYKEGKYFIEAPVGFWSNCGLALSRKGMKYFIDCINKEFIAADIVAFENKNKNKFYGKYNLNNDLKHYIPTIPLCYLNDGINSQVQQSDKAELYEYYKYINKNFYNIYENT